MQDSSPKPPTPSASTPAEVTPTSNTKPGARASSPDAKGLSRNSLYMGLQKEAMAALRTQLPDCPRWMRRQVAKAMARKALREGTYEVNQT